MSQYLFVYGTLRPPRLHTAPEDSRFYPLIASYVRAHQPATLRCGALFSLGAYPGAVRTGDEVDAVHGDLIQLDDEAIAVADHIEGHPHFFRRDRVTVSTINGAQVDAWIYLCPPELTVGKRPIASGDWFDRSSNQQESEMTTIPEGAADPTLHKLVQRFSDERCSWLSSVRPDGRAHNAPVWHVWYRGRADVVTRPQNVKVKNVAENPSVVLAHPDPVNALIIEGWATESDEMRAPLQPYFKEKYDWDISTDRAYGVVLEITPTKLIAWGEFGEGRWAGPEIVQVWLEE